MKLKKTDYILIAVLILLVIGLVYVSRKTDKEERDQQEIINIKEKYILVKEKSTFFTVESCANRYIISLGNGNVDNLLKLADQEYISKNNLNKDNIVDKLGALNGDFNFKAKKIYYTKDGNIYTYYVYGLLQENMINEYDYGKDYYLIVKIDKNKNLFSIIPYDGSYFKEAN